MVKKAVFIALIAVVGSSFAQLGIFDAEGEVGNPAKTGKVLYDSIAKEYTITGGGHNMFHAEDQCHFVWKKMAGDFTVRARSKGYIVQGAEPAKYCKAGWMFRKNLSTGSPYAGTAIHQDGNVSVLARPTQSVETKDVIDTKKVTNATPIIVKFQRKGDTYIMGFAVEGAEMRYDTIKTTDFGQDSLLLGLYVCSNNDNGVESFVFDSISMVIGNVTPIVPMVNVLTPSSNISIQSLIHNPELFSSIMVTNSRGQCIPAGKPAFFSSIAKRLESGIYYVKARSLTGAIYNLKFIQK
jgi:hypothetical protein